MRSNSLTHHGVLGMHWGVRKPEPVGTERQATSSEKEYAKKFSEVQKQLKDSGLNETALRDKYGDPNGNGFLEFVKEHKRGIEIGAVAALGVAGVAALYYSDKPDFLSDITNFRAIVSKTDGLALNWDKGVDLPIGSIINRVSSVAETTVRPEGFFGSFLPGDVQSYKAVLPGYFNQWGVGDAKFGGFVNSYKSLVSVKAPSGKESVGIFKEFVKSGTQDSKNVLQVGKFLTDPIGMLRAGMEPHPESMTESDWRKVFKASTVLFASPKGGGKSKVPGVEAFIDAFRSKGYNAIIDFNDAGTLAKTPVRLLNGSDFQNVGWEALHPDDILKAISVWSPSLAHSFTGSNQLFHGDMNVVIKIRRTWQ